LAFEILSFFSRMEGLLSYLNLLLHLTLLLLQVASFTLKISIENFNRVKSHPNLLFNDLHFCPMNFAMIFINGNSLNSQNCSLANH
jgi:hypothetical protein